MQTAFVGPGMRWRLDNRHRGQDLPLLYSRRRTRLLLMTAMFTDAAFPAIVAALDAAAPGLDPWRHTLSRHEQAPGFPWIEVAFLAHALAMGLLAIALRCLPPRPWAGPAALWIGAVASALLAVAPADEAGLDTTAGHIHESVAPVAFIAIAAAGFFSWRDQRASTAWKGLERAPRISAFLLIGALTFFGLLLAVVQMKDEPRIILGAAERFVIVGIAAWVLSETVQGMRLAGHPLASGRKW